MDQAKRILIAGGTGGVGRALQNHFRQRALIKTGDSVHFTVLTRDKRRTLPSSGLSFMTWEELEKEGLPDCQAVINLTGANIMQSRWSKTGPVYTSRINTTRTLVDAMRKNPPRAFVSGSAVGIYPVNTKEVLDENSSLPAYDEMNFAQQLCYDWEQEAKTSKDIKDLTTTILRISFVFGPEQNGVKAMKLPLGLVGISRLGSGQQAFPWIHEIDLAEMIFHAAMDPDAKGGTVNAVAPQRITQEQFSTLLNRATGTMINVPVPEFLLRPLGEKSALLLDGPNVTSTTVNEVLPSFEYYYPTLHKAFENTRW